MSLMSLKAELETWVSALQAYDQEDFEKSLELFSQIADSSKILTNMGLIYATLGEHEAAIERFSEATQLDQYLAVAYFQSGVSNFLLGRYEMAIRDFDDALLYLRGNQAINYEQIGLKFLLYSAEILFNKGLCLVYLSQTEDGLAVMEDARQEKATDEHNVIDDAIQDQGEGYTVFSIPVGVLYRPSESKIKNAKTKDYMGKAKLVATTDLAEAFTTFSGATRLQQGISPSGALIERPSPPDTESSPVVGLGRSVTLPSQSATDGSRLPRSNTSATLPVRQVSPTTSEPTATVARSNTTLNVARPSPNASIGGPGRGLSIKRPVATPSSPASAEKDRVPSPPKDRLQRVTTLIDNFLDSYGEETPPPLPSAGPSPSPDRVAAWARSNANPNNVPQRTPSRAPSSYSPSSQGSSRRSRRLTRRATGRNRAPPPSMYDEEEEGYGSGDYDDGPFELTKIRIKLHYQDDVRGMAVTPDIPFEELLERITSKFDRALNGLGLKFKDEDGGMVTLRDESDYELAIETARESAKGKPEGKLEIWCSDI